MQNSNSLHNTDEVWILNFLTTGAQTAVSSAVRISMLTEEMKRRSRLQGAWMGEQGREEKK